MARINVAIVGCGFVARGHLAAWRKIPQATVVAICDANEDALRRSSTGGIGRARMTTSFLVHIKIFRM
jgi:predicted dehydrogenase